MSVNAHRDGCGSWISASGWSVGQVGADAVDAGNATHSIFDLDGSLGGVDVAVQNRDAVLDGHVDAGVLELLLKRADGGPDAVGEDRVVHRGAGVAPRRSIRPALGLVYGAMQVWAGALGEQL